MRDEIYVVNVKGKVKFLSKEEYEKLNKNDIWVFYGILSKEEYEKREWEIANYKGTEIFYRFGVPPETKRAFRLVNEGIPLDFVYRAPIVLAHDALVDFVLEYVKAMGKKKSAVRAMAKFFGDSGIQERIEKILKETEDPQKIKEKVSEILGEVLVS